MIQYSASIVTWRGLFSSEVFTWFVWLNQKRFFSRSHLFFRWTSEISVWLQAQESDGAPDCRVWDPSLEEDGRAARLEGLHVTQKKKKKTKDFTQACHDVSILDKLEESALRPFLLVFKFSAKLRNKMHKFSEKLEHRRNTGIWK